MILRACGSFRSSSRYWVSGTGASFLRQTSLISMNFIYVRTYCGWKKSCTSRKRLFTPWFIGFQPTPKILLIPMVIIYIWHSSIPSGNLLHSKLEHGPFSSLIYLFKDGDFPVRYVSLPEGICKYTFLQNRLFFWLCKAWFLCFVAPELTVSHSYGKSPFINR